VRYSGMIRQQICKRRNEIFGKGSRTFDKENGYARRGLERTRGVAIMRHPPAESRCRGACRVFRFASRAGASPSRRANRPESLQPPRQVARTSRAMTAQEECRSHRRFVIPAADQQRGGAAGNADGGRSGGLASGRETSANSDHTRSGCKGRSGSLKSRSSSSSLRL